MSCELEVRYTIAVKLCLDYFYIVSGGQCTNGNLDWLTQHTHTTSCISYHRQAGQDYTYCVGKKGLNLNWHFPNGEKEKFIHCQPFWPFFFPDWATWISLYLFYQMLGSVYIKLRGDECVLKISPSIIVHS